MALSCSKQFLIFPMMALALQKVQATESNQLPESRLPEGSIAYSTMEAAAVSALKISASQSTSQEYAGCLYTNGQNFYHTQPTSNGKDDSFAIQCLAPKSLTLTGLYHTHPGGFIEGFSGQDIVVAHQLKVTSYVGLLTSNQVIKYVPGKTQSECFNPGMIACDLGHRISRGRIVQDGFMK